MALPHFLGRKLNEGYHRSEETLALSRVEASVGQECDGAMFHTPRPLFLTQVPLVPIDWLGLRNGEEVWLCGTCQDNLAVYQALLWEHDGEVPWVLRREFGNMIRALGDRSWTVYQRALKKRKVRNG